MNNDHFVKKGCIMPKQVNVRNSLKIKGLHLYKLMFRYIGGDDMHL